MGSLDSATSDNTTQETTLATIRSVSGDWDNTTVRSEMHTASGDWDNSSVSSSTFGGISAFESSGTFTAPNGCTAFKAVVIGAGGGGGGGTSSSNGGMGGAGGTVYAQVHGLSAGTTIAITVGSGSTSTTGEYSNAGGASSFSIHDTSVTANGGNGGQRRARSGINGAGGSASGGYLNFAGRSHSTAYAGGQTDLANATASTPFGNNIVVGQSQVGAYYGLGASQQANGGDGLVLIEW